MTQHDQQPGNNQYGHGQPPQWAPPGSVPPQYNYQAPSPVQIPPRKRRKWPWVVGAIVLLLVVASVAGGKSTTTQVPASPTSNSAAPGAPAAEAADGSVVVYEVTGKGGASVTYMKEDFSQEQQTSTKLPFKKQLQFKDKVGSFNPLSLVAQHSSGAGEITCRITVDGKVVGESTSSGPYAVVTCNGNGG